MITESWTEDRLPDRLFSFHDQTAWTLYNAIVKKQSRYQFYDRQIRIILLCIAAIYPLCTSYSKPGGH